MQVRSKLKAAASALVMLAAGAASGQQVSGIVTDSAGTPIAAAAIRLEVSGRTATSGPDGRFSVTGGSAVQDALPTEPMAAIRDGSMFLSIPERSEITVTAYTLEGKALSSIHRRLDVGSHSLPLPGIGTGVGFYKVKSGMDEIVVKAFAIEGALRGAPVSLRNSSPQGALAKRSSAAAYDVLTVAKDGYLKYYLNLPNADTSNIAVKMLRTTTPRFSFFVASMKALVELSKNEKGFGGDLRFGETGPGAGLRGADKICATIAERSMKGSSAKGWRAFLSVSADAHGRQVNAIDRVGPGPWYDRLGRLLAPTKADLVNVRPANGDVAIRNDLPNEDGVPNHRPNPAEGLHDNHHMMTGSTAAGVLRSASATCKDWTAGTGASANGRPTCGFAWPRGGGGGSGSNWITSYDAPGCAPGIDIFGSGGALPGDVSVGGGGGYGGFYCFALNP